MNFAYIPSKILRLPELIGRIGLSKSAIYDFSNPKSPRFDVTFPRALKLGSRAVGWDDHEVETWLQNRKQIGVANVVHTTEGGA